MSPTPFLCILATVARLQVPVISCCCFPPVSLVSSLVFLKPQLEAPDGEVSRNANWAEEGASANIWGRLRLSKCPSCVRRISHSVVPTSSDGILPASLAARDGHVTSAAPIRSSHLRLCCRREMQGRTELRFLVNKAVKGAGLLGDRGALSRVQCPVLCSSWCGVFSDLGFLVLRKILRAACYASMTFRVA